MPRKFATRGYNITSKTPPGEGGPRNAQNIESIRPTLRLPTNLASCKQPRKLGNRLVQGRVGPSRVWEWLWAQPYMAGQTMQMHCRAS